MKSNYEAVKRWKQANRDRVNELNRKSHAKVGRKSRVKVGVTSNGKKCACGNLAYKKTSDGHVCERCNRIERKNRKYENDRTAPTLISTLNSLHISREVYRSWQRAAAYSGKY